MLREDGPAGFVDGEEDAGGGDRGDDDGGYALVEAFERYPCVQGCCLEAGFNGLRTALATT